MVFSSTEFLFLFLPALIIIYYLPCFRNRKLRNLILLIFSLFFYAWGEPIFVFAMIFSIMVNWAISLAIEKYKHRKIWLFLAIVFDLLLLAVFKYTTFLTKNVALLFHDDSLVVNIALPIGISFFTFQMMSYVFDVYYGKSCAQKNPFYVGLYIALFPQLIAGPIVRYNQIEREIECRNDTLKNILVGTERFIYGLGKKVLVANYVGFIADRIFVADERSVATAWLGAIAYTLQIYFDFSGYSDMAIGLGKMFGFSFPENFNYPYIACSVTEFWRRWHISLSIWFRDYVYIPLGGNLVPPTRWICNMFVVWALTGIWHGANWTFLCWGLWYFVLLIIEKTTEFHKKLGFFSHIYTIIVVILAWVIFRSDNLAAAIAYIGDMIGVHSIAIVDELFWELLQNGFVVLIVSISFSYPLYTKILDLLSSGELKCGMCALLCAFIFCLSIIQIVASTYNPFIYFNF